MKRAIQSEAALRSCHILHLDARDANMIYDERNKWVVFIDFGSSQYHEQDISGKKSLSRKLMDQFLNTKHHDSVIAWREKNYPKLDGTIPSAMSCPD